MQAWSEQHTTTVLTERERAAAMQAETAHVADLARSASPLLVADDPEGAEIIEAALDGLVARKAKDGTPMTRGQIEELRAKVEGHYSRVADREVARRAAESADAAKRLPPNGKPSSGDGQPKVPESDKPSRAPQETMRDDRDKSRAAFLTRNQT
jgi:hypothetical protein